MDLVGLQVIVDKMVDYLRTTNDEVTKTEVVKRIGELAERFAPDTQWFLDTMNQVGKSCTCDCWQLSLLLVCVWCMLLQCHICT